MPKTMPILCGRCATPLRVWSMSRFNQDHLCIPCLDDEKHAPGYAAAHAAELAAVKAGDYNYSPGLSATDAAFLAQRRQDRAQR